MNTVKLEMFANDLFRKFREENKIRKICSAKIITGYNVFHCG